MVKYRFPGIGGSSLLLLGSSIRLDAGLQFLARTESNHAPRADRNFFAGFGIAARAPVLVAQIEITESREFYLLARGECSADLLEEQIHEFARFALVKTQLIEQGLGHLCLRQGCHAY